MEKDVIYIINKRFNDDGFEFIEKKGNGHPDTLADALAEHISSNYSIYTLKRFGVILHHNFDKIGLLGGASHVSFGNGHLVRPIRVLVNGRASVRFGNIKIEVKRLIIKWVKDFFKVNLPGINPDKNLDFHINLSSESSPGNVTTDQITQNSRRYWFEPRGRQDITELENLVSNDTSLGVGYAPSSILEKIVLDIHNSLIRPNHLKKNPWLGTDIKILAFRYKNEVSITMCIPQIANHVRSIEDYKRNLQKTIAVVRKIVNNYPVNLVDLYVNMRDRYEAGELYLTAIGSSLESGDEGLVGRGNRVNGVISPLRPMSIEGACGKNPVYHVGKLYYLTAFKIAQNIYKIFSVPNEVYLASQSGRDLLSPWVAVIALPSHFRRIDSVRKIVRKSFNEIPNFTQRIISGQERLF